MTAAVAAAVRARLAAAFPAAADVSDAPEPTGAGRLPAFAVRVRRLSSEIVTIGTAPEVEETLDISVAFWRTGESSGFWDALAGDAAAIRAAVFADPPDLDDLVAGLDAGAEEFDLEVAEKRVGRAEVVFEARRIAPRKTG